MLPERGNHNADLRHGLGRKLVCTCTVGIRRTRVTRTLQAGTRWIHPVKLLKTSRTNINVPKCTKSATNLNPPDPLHEVAEHEPHEHEHGQLAAEVHHAVPAHAVHAHAEEVRVPLQEDDVVQRAERRPAERNRLRAAKIGKVTDSVAWGGAGGFSHSTSWHSNLSSRVRAQIL